MTRRLKSGAIAAVDQAWISLVNFSIAFLFIRFGEKSEYGVYTMLMTLVYFIQSIQNALILSPLATVLPAADASERSSVTATALRAQTSFLLGAAIIAALGLLGYQMVSGHEVEPILIIAFALGAFGISAREGLRAFSYCEGNVLAALKGDLLFGAFALVALLAIAWFSRIDAGLALAATGFAALVPFVLMRQSAGEGRFSGGMWGRFWACGRWSLIGAGLTWVNLYAYPLIVGLRTDAETVAELSAARLFLTPAAIGITAWSNLCRPKISGWFSRSDLAPIRRISLYSLAAALFALALFSLFVHLFYGDVEPVLGSQYGGLQGVVMAWSVFFVFSVARSIFMASLMVNEQGYKALQTISVASLLLSLTGLWFAAPFGAVAVVGVLCLVEAFQALIVGRLAFGNWRSA